MGPDRLQGGVAMGWTPVAVAPKDYYYYYHYYYYHHHHHYYYYYHSYH